MKSFVVSFAIVSGFFAAAPVNAASRCEQQFRTVEAVEEGRSDFKEIKREYVRQMIDIGLEKTAYVTKWKLTQKGIESAQGRFPNKGEFVVTGVPTNKFKRWMDTVGKDTVGLVISGHPNSDPGTASLRIGRHYFGFSEVQIEMHEAIPTSISRFSSTELTEITLPMSAAEQKAILDFIRARQNHEILAKHSRGAGVKEGEPIAPAFDSTSFTLARESCAAACTSWFDSRWLDHYDTPAALREIMERFDLKATYIAKQMLWGHVRLPGPIGLTIFSFDTMPENIRADFLGKNEWFSVRGMPAYGYMPDPKSGSTSTISSERKTLSDWLAN